MTVEKRQSPTQMHRFNLKKGPLEICKLHLNLGTVITNNGNFKVNSARVLGEQCTLCLVALIYLHQEI